MLRPGSGEVVLLEKLAGRVLAEDLFSPIDLPPFRQSSMDGYALVQESGRQRYQVVGETRAGDAPGQSLLAGQARRVFTGAALPEGANLVVRQEVATRDGEWVDFSAETDQPGRFVRETGSAVQKGELILSQGTLLNAGSLSFLASCGLDQALVYAKPRVSILASGDELQAPGTTLAPGKIFESNTYALHAAVRALGIEDIKVHRLPDQEQAITEALQRELDESDVLLLSGGISVGEYDFSGRALRNAGVDEVFYRVAQKPGMPLFFGVRNQTLVFGLPGNPASSLVCFWEYARWALRVLMGFKEPGLVEVQLPIAHALHKTAPRASFERALVLNGTVRSLEGQDSYQLRSLAEANALLVLPEGAVEFAAGELATVHLLNE